MTAEDHIPNQAGYIALQHATLMRKQLLSALVKPNLTDASDAENERWIMRKLEIRKMDYNELTNAAGAFKSSTPTGLRSETK